MSARYGRISLMNNSLLERVELARAGRVSGNAGDVPNCLNWPPISRLGARPAPNGNGTALPGGFEGDCYP